MLSSRTRIWINHNNVWTIFREKCKQEKQQKIYTTRCIISKIVQEKEYRVSLKSSQIWCKSRNYVQMIPNEGVKRMMRFCIMGSARKKIVLFHPTGLAFKNHGTGDFLQKCSHKKNMRKVRDKITLTRIDKKQREKRRRPEELMQTRWNRNRNTWTGNRKMVKISENIMLPRERVMVTSICSKQEERGWIQGWNAQGTVQNRDEGTCLFFMPKEPKRKQEIKAVLDRQLSPDRNSLVKEIYRIWEESKKKGID